MPTLLHALTLGLYAAVGAVYATTLATGRTSVPRPGVLLIAAAVVSHASALIAYTAAYGELPLVGIAASLSSFAFLIGTSLLATALVTESRPLGLVLTPIIALLLIAVLALGVAPAGEEPEFRGVWFVAHVLLAFVGYAGMAVAFACSLLYLLQFRELKSKRFGRLFRFVPSLEMLDSVAHRALLVGFSTLTLALVLGWAWTVRFKHSLEMSDPKILWASFSWIAFAAALAARSGGAGAERRAARVNIGAFTAIIVAYIIVRIAVARGGVFL
jgi:ABC-type transport system involved in cytochrome c biogenesis permease subunit